MKAISMSLMALALFISHSVILGTGEGLNPNKQQGFEPVVSMKMLSTTDATEGKEEAEEEECG
jgi:hypothetical protein